MYNLKSHLLYIITAFYRGLLNSHEKINQKLYIYKRFLVYVMQQELRDSFSSMNGELLVET